MTNTNERDDDPLIIVCQGPPSCLLVGDDALQSQLNGCLKCKRMDIGEAMRKVTLQ